MTPGVALQYLVPQKLLSRMVYAFTRWRWRPFKDALIRVMTRLYDIDVGEAASADPADYAHFNAFFTRALKDGARPLDPDSRALVMPADGRVSQLGAIREGRIFQAKTCSFDAAELLADAAAAHAFDGGSFVTVYLSPRDYHRVHIPFGGRLLETVHVPGRLFSVSPSAVECVPRLFARNERLICHYETDFGPMAVILVGAMLVSGVETVWGGVEIPPYASRIERRDYRDATPAIALDRGAELGRFNMGSTVIVLLPPGFAFEPSLGPDAAVKMGQRLAARTF